jgi:hypothetical protein
MVIIHHEVCNLSLHFLLFVLYGTEREPYCYFSLYDMLRDCIVAKSEVWSKHSESTFLLLLSDEGSTPSPLNNMCKPI